MYSREKKTKQGPHSLQQNKEDAGGEIYTPGETHVIDIIVTSGYL